VVLSNGTGMKGARMNGATVSIGSEKFRESHVEVIGNERGDNVLFTVRDNKEMMRTNGVKIVFPTRARVYAWLRAHGTWSTSLCVSIHRFGC